MARVAGGYAADNASAWKMPQNAAKLADYQDLVANDAAAINCELPKVAGKIHVPDPAFPAGFDMGDPAEIDHPMQLRHPDADHLARSWAARSSLRPPPRTPCVRASSPRSRAAGARSSWRPIADFVGTPQSGYGLTTASRVWARST